MSFYWKKQHTNGRAAALDRMRSDLLTIERALKERSVGEAYSYAASLEKEASALAQDLAQALGEHRARYDAYLKRSKK